MLIKLEKKPWSVYIWVMQSASHFIISIQVIFNKVWSNRLCSFQFKFMRKYFRSKQSLFKNKNNNLSVRWNHYAHTNSIPNHMNIIK